MWRVSLNSLKTKFFIRNANLRFYGDLNTWKCAKENYITDDEFLSSLENCKPPGNWPKRIAVAFSGGPDSTCLLFLLSRLINYSKLSTELSRYLYSVYIDHDLQVTSTEMAHHCARFADSISIPHIMIKIPWSIPPFPSKPAEGSFERIARDARYHLLFQIMQQKDIDILAFGHHADDQVETALMRIARGSSEIGAGGMRSCRRLGMGLSDDPTSVGWFGHRGMNKWIVRPLLTFSKDRILATCAKYKLPFLEDPTNAQPDITPRNALRKALQQSTSSQGLGGEIATAEKLIVQLLSNFNTNNDNDNDKQSHNSIDLPIMERLRRTVRHLSQRVELSDAEATRQLKRCLLPSPISTVLLSHNDFNEGIDHSVKTAMILRILRYVSPLPWGSVKAEAGRRSESIQRILFALTKANSEINSIVAGGAVVWSPIAITASGELKRRPPLTAEKLGWLASRQPPLRSLGVRSDLELDITSDLIAALDKKINMEILYDYRFLILVKPQLLPEEITSTFKRRFSSTRVCIEPTMQYFLPQIIWRRKPSEDVLLARFEPSGLISHGRFRQLNLKIFIDSEWINIKWIRTLDSDSPIVDTPIRVPQ